MAVNLQKGEKVKLRKEKGGTLRKVVVGLNWDEAPMRNQGNFDCDASAFLCKNGRLEKLEDIVYYNNLCHKSGCVTHSGDNLRGSDPNDGGKKDEDDEQIVVDLASMPEDYDRIVFVVNIFNAIQRGQHFGMISNAFMRICDKETGQELYRYNLSENYENMTAMVFGELCRAGDAWKFHAIGDATKDSSIGRLSKRFMLDHPYGK